MSNVARSGSSAQTKPGQPPPTAALSKERSKEELETAEALLKYGHPDRSQWDTSSRSKASPPRDSSAHTSQAPAFAAPATNGYEPHNVAQKSVEGATTNTQYVPISQGQTCR